MLSILPKFDDLAKSDPTWRNWFSSLRTYVLKGEAVGDVREVQPTESFTIPHTHRNLHIRIEGANGNPVTVNANPQIIAGFDGQTLMLEGMSNTATVEWQHGDGLQLKGGANITLGEGDNLVIHYTKSRGIWTEDSRSINN